MPSSTEGTPTLALPDNPDLKHLRQQARDLLATGEVAKLSAAQFQIARRYGFPSWPKLKAHVESLQEVGQLKTAIDTEDWETVRRLMTANPDLHRAPLGYNNNGPLTWLAECRFPRRAPSVERLEMAQWMIQNGSDVHQGGDGPLMRASLNENRIPMMALLVAHGADVNAVWNGHYPILFGPCETHQPSALHWLLDHGADPKIIPPHLGNPIAMLVGTYARHAAGKHACLETFIQMGYELPDTPAIALHRGRLDLLGEFLRRDPALLQRHFTEAEIFPPEVGIKPGEVQPSTSVVGGTLLHLAVEFNDIEAARWLLAQGADGNARTVTDSEGYGGHTPLFHTTVAMGIKEDRLARLLLDHGADPNARANLRGRFEWLSGPDGEKEHQFREVTPLGYANQYPIPEWRNTPAITLLSERGGLES